MGGRRGEGVSKHSNDGDEGERRGRGEVGWVGLAVDEVNGIERRSKRTNNSHQSNQEMVERRGSFLDRQSETVEVEFEEDACSHRKEDTDRSVFSLFGGTLAERTKRREGEREGKRKGKEK